jgi:alkanesulfonate monooxygenase SsuD/methylene tetrahydromethanopterin reductase-like flavin-dependent oxidoreductase (luciferase family)
MVRLQSPSIRIGALLWNQYTDWPSLRRAAQLADRLGYESLWTWDHLYPVEGDPDGPLLEGYTLLAAWAAITRWPTVGLMVGANTFRNPALVAKMVTTLDHVSDGRAVLGIGGAWFEPEHTAFGIDFGASMGERLERLDEAVELIRAMLRGEAPSARGVHYHARSVRNDPAPLQEALPILIGGTGERKTLATVARYADAWNAPFSLGLEAVKRKNEVLREWCERIGRDDAEIERTLGTGALIIRDSVAEARRAVEQVMHKNPAASEPKLAGPTEQIVEQLAPYVRLGFHHLIVGSPAPHDLATAHTRSCALSGRDLPGDQRPSSADHDRPLTGAQSVNISSGVLHRMRTVSRSGCRSASSRSPD